MVSNKILHLGLESAYPWGRDKLSTFLKGTEENTFKSTINFEKLYRRLVRVDETWWHASETTEVTAFEDLLPPLLMRLSNSAWEAGVRVGLGGQPVDTQPLFRSALEYAGYALHIHEDPALRAVWLARHMSDKDRQACRDAFTVGKVKRAISSKNTKRGASFAKLYDLLVDAGAHPNVGALLARWTTERTERATISEVTQITNDPLLYRQMIWSALSTGIECLRVFELIFSVKFRLVSLDLEIDRLSPE
jgi:hypothetical protein